MVMMITGLMDGLIDLHRHPANGHLENRQS